MFENTCLFRMDPKIKADWVAALRSGNYAQGTGYLLQMEDDQPRYCCLGVLSELAVRAKMCHVEMVPESNITDQIALFDSCEDVLPQSVRFWVGDRPNDSIMIQGVLPFRDRRGHQILLTELNDTDQLTFDQIADLIEYFY